MRRIIRLQLVIVALLAIFCSTAFAATVATHRVHRRHFRWLRWNPMFRPSHESLLIQNAEIDRLDLPRIQNDTELEALKGDGSLLPIRAGETLRFDPRLDPSRRYCRPWTRNFVEDLQPGVLQPFSSADSSELSGTHGEVTEETSPGEPQCRAG